MKPIDLIMLTLMFFIPASAIALCGWWKLWAEKKAAKGQDTEPTPVVGIPRPASPLPWLEGRIEKSALAARGGRGFVVLRRTNDDTIPAQGDWDYLKWAVNNAPELAKKAAKCDRLMDQKATIGAVARRLGWDGVQHLGDWFEQNADRLTEAVRS
jgi:hypothetical protein